MNKQNIYIVFELNEIANVVHEMRLKFDLYRASLPAEITIAGSSGVGPVARQQDINELIRHVDSVASKLKTFEFEFGPVKRFPDSDTFVFTIIDPTEFLNAHALLKNSPIQFQKTEYEFEPHCTISSKSDISESEIDEIMKLNIAGKIRINAISVYQMPPPMKLLHKVHLNT